MAHCKIPFLYNFLDCLLPFYFRSASFSSTKRLPFKNLFRFDGNIRFTRPYRVSCFPVLSSIIVMSTSVVICYLILNSALSGNPRKFLIASIAISFLFQSMPLKHPINCVARTIIVPISLASVSMLSNITPKHITYS